MNYRRGLQRQYLVLKVAPYILALTLMACNGNRYEVIERTNKEVANFQKAGTHSEIHYVLLHDGHKIYATCDFTDVKALDPHATCGFRPLRTYECVLGRVTPHGDLPLSDLKCKDADGNNVYLYVDKKE